MPVFQRRGRRLSCAEVHRLNRIAVVDFDVHHGNGTQAAFWDDPDMLLISLHQSPLYPGTGAATERSPANSILNIPLPPLSGSAEFRHAFSSQAMPRLSAFDPDFLLVSAGFDAHEDDPLAGLQFQDDDFAWATSELLAVANHACRADLFPRWRADTTGRFEDKRRRPRASADGRLNRLWGKGFLWPT